jgi:hypothetical protein
VCDTTGHECLQKSHPGMLKMLQSATRRRWLAVPLLEAALCKQHVHSRRLCSSGWGAASAAPENSSPFVSKYHQVDPSDITTYLTRKGLEFKVHFPGIAAAEEMLVSLGLSVWCASLCQAKSL